LQAAYSYESLLSNSTYERGGFGERGRQSFYDSNVAEQLQPHAPMDSGAYGT
jgi:hypothetical protein